MDRKRKQQFNPKISLAYLEMCNHLRFFQIFSIVVTICLFIVLGLLGLELVSSDKQVHYVAFSGSDDVHFKVLPAPLSKSQGKLLLRQQLRDYVYNRAYIDNFTEKARFRKVYSMNTAEENEKFREEFDRIKSESSFERRDVKVVADNSISNNIHQIELETIDHFQGKKYKNYWTVLIKHELRKQQVSLTNEHLNPFGLTVTEYQIRKKDITYNEEINE
jgi:type IV secretory pathway component VirB8